ncbi:hypothetical protein J1614_006461 [Plenodomus biglobosus]|nr:hypothetical protein J1614_006461 [Plenodomus biglobosus]
MITRFQVLYSASTTNIFDDLLPVSHSDQPHAYLRRHLNRGQAAMAKSRLHLPSTTPMTTGLTLIEAVCVMQLGLAGELTARKPMD